jgi:hypothetical protein
VIQNKMALSNMRTKQTRRDYSSLDEFTEDVELIASNCVTFNGEGTIYGQVKWDTIACDLCSVSLLTL